MKNVTKLVENILIRGNLRALKGGITTDKIFCIRKRAAERCNSANGFYDLCNVVFSYGAKKFISACREIEIDGLILPDLPLRKRRIHPICSQYGVDLISLIAPTSKTGLQ